MTELSKNGGVNPRWRLAFYGLLALFIALVLLAGYGIVDQAVTITYMQEGMKTADDATDGVGPWQHVGFFE